MADGIDFWGDVCYNWAATSDLLLLVRFNNLEAARREKDLWEKDARFSRFVCESR